MASSDVDVLIVGGGPTGLTAALELSCQGINFRIIDKHLEPLKNSRALALQGRTRELLSRHNIQLEGRSPRGVAFIVNGREILNVDVPEPSYAAKKLSLHTRTPYPLFLSQYELEQLLEKQLAAHSHVVERGTRASEIVADDTGVAVNLQKPDGTTEALRCKYIIGADGANSTVRKSNPTFQFIGAEYPQEFFLCDCRIKWEKDWSAKGVFIFGASNLVCIPQRDDVIRLFAPAAAMKLSPEATPNLHDFQNYMNSLAPGQGKIHDPIWLYRFKLSNRSANVYRDGRFILAGDSAHVHSPAGGQGMNTGIQDAINACWKLGMVLRGEANDSLLESYDAERRPVGDKVLQTTDRLFTNATSMHWIFVRIRNFLMPLIMPFLLLRTNRGVNGFKFNSQLFISYHKSAIVSADASYNGHLRVGNRAPDGELIGGKTSSWLLDTMKPGKSYILIFEGTGAARTDQGDLRNIQDTYPVEVLTVSSRSADLHEAYGMEEGGFAFIRPDCHVGYIAPFSANALSKFDAWWTVMTSGCIHISS